jgi:hypothetical protein
MESQALDVVRAKAKGEVKALSGKASAPRRSPRKTGKQDTEVHSIPYKKGLRMMSEREASECAQHGEVLRWITDSGEDEVYPQPILQLVEEDALDSEGPTEFRGVWEQVVQQDSNDVAGDTPTRNVEVGTRGSDVVGNQVMNAESPNPGVSPCLPEFESPGFLSRRKAISKQAKAKMGHFERAKPLNDKSSADSQADVPVTKLVKRKAPASFRPLKKKLLKRKAPSSSDSEADNVPIASSLVLETVPVQSEASRPRRRLLKTLSEGKRHIDSDCEDDLVPITATLTKPLPDRPTPLLPTGKEAIGLIVARDFGPDGGIFHGRISAVNMEGRRVHYYVTYDDGDEEDFDFEELKYAVELQQSVALGTYEAVEVTHNSDITYDADEVSIDDSYDGDSLNDLTKKGANKKRNGTLAKKMKVGLPGRDVDKSAAKVTKATMKKKGKQQLNSGGKTTFSIESVIESFKDTTEYGASFRSMTAEEQQTEVVRLNKGAATGTKGAIRKQRIDVQFKTLVNEKMKAFIIANRTEQACMFRNVVQPRILHKSQLKFLSVGEWVEVDADRTPGWNSEGGIAVIVGVNDGLADVK